MSSTTFQSPSDVLNAMAQQLQADFGFFSVTEEGVFNYANEACHSIVGMEPGQLLGKNYTELLTDAMCNKSLGRVGSTARGENGRQFTICELNHANGTRRTVQVCKVPVSFPDGTRGTAGFVRDLGKDQAGISHVLEAERAAAENSLKTLDPRQWEVLSRIVDGWPNKQIALRLGVSQRTVEAERAKILKKLGAANFTEAVRTYIVGTSPRSGDGDAADGAAAERTAQPGQPLAAPSQPTQSEEPAPVLEQSSSL